MDIKRVNYVWKYIRKFDYIAETTDVFLHCQLLIFIYANFPYIAMQIIAVAKDFST